MPSGTFLRRPAVLLALCLCSVGAVVTLLGRLATGPAAIPKSTEIKDEPGAKAYPVFSPDGSRLAYSGRGTSSKDDIFHIVVRDIPAGQPQQLTHGPGNDIGPAWSTDGARLAFVRVDEQGASCVVIPTASPNDEHKYPGCGAPGDEVQHFPAVSWMHDGRSLVVVQTAEKQPSSLAVLSLDNGSIHAITHPPAGTDGDSTPVVSPDGNTIAFVRGTISGGADIFLSDTAGANPPRRLTFDDHAIRGITWSRDGQDLMYTGDRAGGWKVWRVQAYGGSPRDLIIAGRNATYVTAAPLGNRLVYTVSPTVSSIWRGALNASDDAPGGQHDSAGEGRAVIRSSGREACPRYSPDGKMIADISDQSGYDEIWLSDADGGNRVQLTHLNGPDLARIRWSPDGKMLIFDSSGDHGQELLTMPIAGGSKPVNVQIDAINGSYSHDGKSIYFQARGQIWKASLNGGNPVQLSKQIGAAQPVESADGKFIYFRNRRTFYRVPVAGGDEEEVIVPEHDLGWTTTIQPTRTGVYYMEFERSSRSMAVSFFDFATKRSSVTFRFKDPNFGVATYSVSPDGKTVLYPRVDQSQTNLVIVDNFR
jgi:Tol biopolymer transport system component